MQSTRKLTNLSLYYALFQQPAGIKTHYRIKFIYFTKLFVISVTSLGDIQKLKILHLYTLKIQQF